MMQREGSRNKHVYTDSDNKSSDVKVCILPTVKPVFVADQEQPISSRTRSKAGYHCTQRCLLGLKHGGLLDRKCPNNSQHRRGGYYDRHPIDESTFQLQIQAQLAETLDKNCDPLWKQGARGSLFKIRHKTYGYTVAGKGTISAFIPDLQHEGAVYAQLINLQGSIVPVCLGNIDLELPYHLDLSVRIVHMLLMSWAGESPGEDITSYDPHLQDELRQAVSKLEQGGVIHGDVREANILRNAERRGLMLIDFERSRFRKYHMKSLAPLQSNQNDQNGLPNALKPPHGRESVLKGKDSKAVMVLI
jgi:hypothetical protein